MEKKSRFSWEVRPAALQENMVIGAHYRFTVLTPKLLRLEYSPDGVFEDRASQTAFYRDFPKCSFETRTGGDVLTLETEALILTYRENAPFDDQSLSVKLKIEPASVWRYGEDFEDLGGTARTLDEIDGPCPVERGVCSRNGFSVIDDSSLVLEEDGWIGVRAEGNTDCYFFGYGFDYIGAVQDLYRLTGVPPMLPAYALGNWWSRYYAYTQQEYLDLMDRFREEDIPLSVGVVDMDWHVTEVPGNPPHPDPRNPSGWTGYSWNKELFPDYKAFLKALHERNLKTALNLHPAYGVCSHEDMYAEMARACGVDPRTKERIPLDLLSPAFMEKYFDILHHPYEDAGVDFWWMDWQQGTNYWWIHTPNAPGEYLDPRERMDPLWLLNHLHILDISRDGKRPMFFSRYAGPGSHRYPVGFSGDTSITWDSLKFQPEFTALASNIGYSWWSHDIGGHMGGGQDDELFVRWVQYGVFSPINRLHGSKHRFMCKEPWNYLEPAGSILGKWLRLRHSLFPYIYTMNYRNHTELLPLVQPMYYSHPKCDGAYKVPTQFWFGSELIASPVVEAAAPDSGLGRAEVWLPQGSWFDFFTGLHYTSRRGRKIEVYRAMQNMPVFAKAGAIVPMAKYPEGENRLCNAEEMEVLVFPGADGSFTMYEDAGEGNDFEKGAFAKTCMELKWGNGAVFTVHAAEGDLTLIPQVRKWRIGLRGFHQDVCVTGGTVQRDPRTNTVWVTVEAPVTAAVRVEISGQQMVWDNADVPERCEALIRTSQLSFDDKKRLWGTVTGGRMSMRAKIFRLRTWTRSVGKAVLELLTLTEDI